MPTIMTTRHGAIEITIRQMGQVIDVLDRRLQDLIARGERVDSMDNHDALILHQIHGGYDQVYTIVRRIREQDLIPMPESPAPANPDSRRVREIAQQWRNVARDEEEL